MNPRAKPLIAALVFVAALFVMSKLIGRDPSQRNFEIFTDMQYSLAYEPNTPNPNYANGMTQQQLVAGVVLHEGDTFPYGASLAEAERAGRELTNPFAKGDKNAIALGAKLFPIYCAVCHGGGGMGNGPVTRRGMFPPPSLLAAHAKQLKDGHIFHILTRGQGNMASYAAQLNPHERWALVSFVRSLQGN